MKLYIFILIICSLIYVNSNQNKSDVSANCIQNIVDGINHDYPNNAIQKLNNYQLDNSEYKSWLDTMKINRDGIKIYYLKYRDNHAFLFVSNNMNSTGLGSNFYYWYIHTKNYALHFESLSDTPKLIFFDNKGCLNYYSIDYNSEWLDIKDWDNIKLDISKYELSNKGESFLIEKVSKFCR